MPLPRVWGFCAPVAGLVRPQFDCMGLANQMYARCLRRHAAVAVLWLHGGGCPFKLSIRLPDGETKRIPAIHSNTIAALKSRIEVNSWVRVPDQYKILILHDQTLPDSIQLKHFEWSDDDVFDLVIDREAPNYEIMTFSLLSTAKRIITGRATHTEDPRKLWAASLSEKEIVSRLNRPVLDAQAMISIPKQGTVRQEEAPVHDIEVRRRGRRQERALRGRESPAMIASTNASTPVPKRLHRMAPETVRSIGRAENDRKTSGSANPMPSQSIISSKSLQAAENMPTIPCAAPRCTSIFHSQPEYT